MLDPLVQRLLEQVVDSPVKLHLLLLFHENPRLEASAVKMAERTCRDIWSVTAALEELVADGVMRSVAQAGYHETTFRYAPRPEIVESIRRLVRGYDDPIERDYLQRVLRDLSAYASVRRSSVLERELMWSSMGWLR
ncbi:hypothetical protein HC891_01045 [Candidatus Gracilibacteria bacterium]|nr:hypothetical protein [Candidatus Gracilibacteria bacterium]